MAQDIVDNADGDLAPSVGIRPRIIVRTDLIGKTQNNPPVDPWAGYPDTPPSSTSKSLAGGNGNFVPPAEGQDQVTPSPWDAYPDAPPEKSQGREIGGAEALGRGMAHGLTLGTDPAIAGAFQAANPDIEEAAKKFGIDPDTAKSFFSYLMPGAKATYGAIRTMYDKATASGPTSATQAYEDTRKSIADENESAREQNPKIYATGDIVGAAAVPLPGFGAAKVAAGLGGRILRGVGAGTTAGASYGAGNAIGEGKSVPEIASDAASGGIVGAVAGGAFNGALGPRAVASTRAEKAAQFADQELGAPLPRGVASNSPMVRATTAKVKEVPFVGERIGGRVESTQQAAGDYIHDMASNLAGGVPTRTSVAPTAAPSIERMVEGNNAKIDQAYDALRRELNPDQHAPMPALQKAIADIKLRRARAGWNNPGEGLEQAENIANGLGHAGGFNGVHRLRRDLREAGNPTKANPGYDKGDFRYLKAAVDKDLKNLVRHVSTNPNRAESLFNTAELKAGDLLKLNEQLDRLKRQKGEGIVGAIIGSAREKAGNIRLLAEIKRGMSPATFDQMSGVLLHELGLAEGQVGEFSLARFATNWNKMSDQAKAIMFLPAHREAIENVVGLGEHLKDAGKYTNNSHTGSIIVLLDIAKDVALVSHDLTQEGNFDTSSYVGGGTTAAALALTLWLGNPKSASAMSKWTMAYRGLTLNQPTPARIAAFKIATRNLANNIHIPFDRIMSAIGDIGVGNPSRGLPVAHATPPDEKNLSR